MPDVIDNRVVQMTFDNAEFEEGVKDTVKSLKELDKSLDLEKSQNVVSRQLTDISNEFSAKAVIIRSIWTGLGNDLYNEMKRLGFRLVNALTSSTRTGFSKYGEMTQAVQTIKFATKDAYKSETEQMKVIEEQLDELMWYTDQTSYSFTDMTSNIGKFTSQGIELKTAVRAMEGITNEAAASGQGINEASRAMYNLSQALARGNVQLMDWKSIETANMATKEFKEQLIETAKAVGTLDKKTGKTKKGGIAVTATNFSETLNKDWLTTDVLIKTLEKYADRTTDFGKKAFLAAQQATTFSQALQAVADAASTGWLKSFTYIFGDLNEAIEIFTDSCNAVIEVIDDINSKRNEILESWKELGGRTNLINAVTNSWTALKEAVYAAVDAFHSVIPELDGSALKDFTQKIEDVTAAIRDFFNVERSIKGDPWKDAGLESPMRLINDPRRFGGTKEYDEAFEKYQEAIDNGYITVEKTIETNDVKLDKTLKRGSTGDAVKELQTNLNTALGTSLAMDGILGAGTEAAIRKFQKEHGLKEDGIYGKETHNALMKAIGKNTKEIEEKVDVEVITEYSDALDHLRTIISTLAKAFNQVWDVLVGLWDMLKPIIKLAWNIVEPLTKILFSFDGVISVVGSFIASMFLLNKLTQITGVGDMSLKMTILLGILSSLATLLLDSGLTDVLDNFADSVDKFADELPEKIPVWFDNLKTKISDFFNARFDIEGLKKKLDGVRETIHDFFNGLLGISSEEEKESKKKPFEKKVKDLTTEMDEYEPKLVTSGEALGKKIRDLFLSIPQKIEEAVKAFKESEFYQTVVTVFSDVVSGVSDFLNTVLASDEDIKELGDDIDLAFGARAGKAVRTFFTKIPGYISTAIGWLTTLKDTIVNSDIYKSIKGFVDSTLSNIGDFFDTLFGSKEDIKEVGDEVEKTGKKGEKTAESLGTKLGNGLLSFFDSLPDKIQLVKDWLSNLWTTITESDVYKWISEKANGAGSFISSFFDGLTGNDVKTESTGSFVKEGKELVEETKEIMDNSLGAQAGRSVKNFFDSLPEHIGELQSWLSNLWTTITESDVYKWITGKVGDVGSNIGSFFNALFGDGLKEMETYKTVGDHLEKETVKVVDDSFGANAARGLTTFFTETLPTYVEQTRTWLSNMWTTVTESDIWKWLQGAADTVGSNVGSFFNALFGDGTKTEKTGALINEGDHFVEETEKILDESTGANIGRSVKNFFANLPENITNVKTFLEDLWTTISTSDVYKFMTSSAVIVGQNFGSFFTSLLGIQSTQKTPGKKPETDRTLRDNEEVLKQTNDIGKNFGAKVGSAIHNFFANLPKYIEAIGKFFASIKQAVVDSGAWERLTEAFGKLKSAIAGLFGVKENEEGNLGESIEEIIGAKTGAIISWASDILAKAITLFSGLIEKLPAIIETVKGFFSGIFGGGEGEDGKGIFGNLIEQIFGENPGETEEAGETATQSVEKTTNTLETVEKGTSVISKIISGLGKGLKGIFDFISKTSGSWPALIGFLWTFRKVSQIIDIIGDRQQAEKYNQLGQIFLYIGVFVGAVAGLIGVLIAIPNDKIPLVSIVLASLAGFLITFAVLSAAIGNMPTINAHDMSSLTASMLAMSILVGAIAIIVAVIMLTGNPDKAMAIFEAVLWSVMGALLAYQLFAKLIAKINIGKSVTKDVSYKFEGMLQLVGAIAALVVVMVVLAFIPIGVLANGAVKLLAVVGVMALMMKALNWASKTLSNQTSNISQTVGPILALTAAIFVIAVAVMMLSMLNQEAIVRAAEAMAIVIGAIASIVGVMALMKVARIDGKAFGQLIAIAAIIAVAAVGFMVLASACENVKPESIVKAGLVIAVIVGAVAAIAIAMIPLALIGAIPTAGLIGIGAALIAIGGILAELLISTAAMIDIAHGYDNVSTESLIKATLVIGLIIDSLQDLSGMMYLLSGIGATIIGAVGELAMIAAIGGVIDQLLEGVRDLGPILEDMSDLDIDSEKVTSAAAVFTSLTDLAKAFSGDGLLDTINFSIGFKTFNEFIAVLPKFVEALQGVDKTFGELNFKGLNNVKKILDLIKPIQTMAFDFAALPETGGDISVWTEFVDDLMPFTTGLTTMIVSLGMIKYDSGLKDSIDTSIGYATSVAGLSQALNLLAFVEWGDSKQTPFTAFCNSLPVFASGCTKMIEGFAPEGGTPLNFDKVPKETIEDAIGIAGSLATLSQQLNIDAFANGKQFADAVGDKDDESNAFMAFCRSLPAFAAGIVEFINDDNWGKLPEDMAAVTAKISSAVGLGQALADLSSDLSASNFILDDGTDAMASLAMWLDFSSQVSTDGKSKTKFGLFCDQIAQFSEAFVQLNTDFKDIPTELIGEGGKLDLALKTVNDIKAFLEGVQQADLESHRGWLSTLFSGESAEDSFFTYVSKFGTTFAGLHDTFAPLEQTAAEMKPGFDMALQLATSFADFLAEFSETVTYQNDKGKDVTRAGKYKGFSELFNSFETLFTKPFTDYLGAVQKLFDNNSGILRGTDQTVIANRIQNLKDILAVLAGDDIFSIVNMLAEKAPQFAGVGGIGDTAITNFAKFFSSDGPFGKLFTTIDDAFNFDFSNYEDFGLFVNGVANILSFITDPLFFEDAITESELATMEANAESLGGFIFSKIMTALQKGFADSSSEGSKNEASFSGMFDSIMQTIALAINSAMDENLEFHPTITPVLVLDDAWNAGIEEMAAGLNLNPSVSAGKASDTANSREQTINNNYDYSVTFANPVINMQSELDYHRIAVEIVNLQKTQQRFGGGGSSSGLRMP